MNKKKVFISSIIKGYRKRRDAAEKALLDLNRDVGFSFEAVCVNKDSMPALNKSPQAACIEAVQSCDIYLGIYPRNNYGWKGSPVGISPTHEEFRESVKRKKPKLIFVENTKETDPDQSRFLSEVGDYVDGRFINEFLSLDDLKFKVYRALMYLMKTSFDEFRFNYSKALTNEYENIITPWTNDVNTLSINDVIELTIENCSEGQKEESETRADDSEAHIGNIFNYRNLLEAIKLNTKLLLTGDPGSGKTTSLKWVTHYYSREGLKNAGKDHHLPIYLELRWYDGDLLNLAASCIARNYSHYDHELFLFWLRDNNFLFILDGFDETADPSKCLRDIYHLIGFSKDSKFVVASRQMEMLADFRGLSFKRIEIKQLSDIQINLFAKSYLADIQKENFFAELESHDFLDEARNPLIVCLLIHAFRAHKHSFMLNKGALFKNVIDNYFLSEWERKVIPAKLDTQKHIYLKRATLAKLAFCMIEEGDVVSIEEYVIKTIFDSILHDGRIGYKDIRDEIYRQLLSSNILIKHGSKVSFWHKSFRDYFAALQLKQIYTKKRKFFWKYCVTQKWADSLTFFVGLLDSPSDFVDKLIKPFWKYYFMSKKKVKVRLTLAASCIGSRYDVSDRTKERIINQLLRIIKAWDGFGRKRQNVFEILSFIFLYNYINAETAFNELAKTGSKEVAKILTGLASHYSKNARSSTFCRYAIEALRNMPVDADTLSVVLSIYLADKDELIATYSGTILRKSINTELSRKFIDILLNKTQPLVTRRRALLVLDPKSHLETNYATGKYNSLKIYEVCVDPFIEIALTEKDDYLRRSATSSLIRFPEHIVENQIVNTLASELCKNPDYHIRANAAYALIYHPSRSQISDALIQALDDKSKEVRKRAAHTLKYVGIESPEMRHEASRKLLGLFDDQDRSLMLTAINAYGVCGRSSREALNKLVNLLKENDISVRAFAAEALGRLGAADARDALNEMIREEGYVEPWAQAIWAVLEIDPGFYHVIKREGWEVPYIADLNSEDLETRKLAVSVLRRIGTETSLSFLKEITNDYEKARGLNEIYAAVSNIEVRVNKIIVPKNTDKGKGSR